MQPHTNYIQNASKYRCWMQPPAWVREFESRQVVASIVDLHCSMAANATVSAAAGALVVGGAAFVASKRAAHTEDPDFDLVWWLD